MIKNLPDEEYICHLTKFLNEGHTVTIAPKGVSMRPFIEGHRDKAEISKFTQLKVGDVAIAKVNTGKYVLHRVIRINGDNITLMGDGNIKGTEWCKKSDVVGIATNFYRKGRKKPDSINGLKWRIYSFLWCRSGGLRRYFLAFYKHIWLRIFPVKLINE